MCKVVHHNINTNINLSTYLRRHHVLKINFKSQISSKGLNVIYSNTDLISHFPTNEKCDCGGARN